MKIFWAIAVITVVVTASALTGILLIQSGITVLLKADMRLAAIMAGLTLTASGIITAIVVSGRITRLFNQMRQENARLFEHNETATAAARTKSRFLANMSHVMRTPLNGVIGLSELSLKKKLPPEISDSFRKIYNSGIVLLDVVNNLLDISNIETGKFDLIPAEYDTANCINNLINTNTIHIGSKPVKFDLILDANFPAMLSGDELRVKQIFNNLLGNAFYYTSEGAVQWRLSAERNDGFVWLVSSISDTGTGIKPEEIEKLFIDYQVLDNILVQNLKGIGLGLPLSKKMAELMGGTISVKSTYGMGTIFTVKLRQNYVNDDVIGVQTAENLKNFTYSEHKRIKNAETPRIQLTGTRVLVVDDIEINCEVAEGILTTYGMEVDCVNSGKKAIELIRKGEPCYNAIFMDHMMPELDGIETTHIIRSEIGSEYAKKIPIIALSANIAADHSDYIMNGGFNDFLSKPIDTQSLDKVICRWIQKDQSDTDRAEESSLAFT
jgi:signal transduction histidine kinase/FixJ family two-component response regulator